MNSKRTLRLGTRRSALAWVQSSQVAAALHAAHPGLEVELVGIETRGDRVLDKPLSEIEGKEFFTAELDHALAAGRSTASRCAGPPAPPVPDGWVPACRK